MAMFELFGSKPEVSPWSVDENGFLVLRPTHPLNPARLLLEQLEAESLVHEDGGSYRMPWSTVDMLERHEDLADVAPLLRLPPLVDARPLLTSHGTPSDEGFYVSVDGWRIGSRTFPGSQARRLGGILFVEGQPIRLPSATAHLLRVLDEVDSEPQTDRESRFYFAARVKSAAHSCNAELDKYLVDTDFVPVDDLDIEIVVDQIQDETVVEVRPSAPGAPEGLLGQFDRYDNVRRQYDVPTPEGGIAHLVLSVPVVDALKSLKLAPGRRFLGAEAEALLRDPSRILGSAIGELGVSTRWDEVVRRGGGLPHQLDVQYDESALLVRLSSIDSDSADAVHRLTLKEDAQDLLRAVGKSRASRRDVFVWRGVRVQRDARAEALLDDVVRWIADVAANAVGLVSSDVFNREAYSSRVAGFDGKPVYVPVLAPPDASNEWLPEGIPKGIVSVDPATGNVSVLPVDRDAQALLKRAVLEARRSGISSVVVPGLADLVPVEEVEEWLKSWHDSAGAEGAQLQSIVKPKPRKTPNLRIFDNIDLLDFGGDVLPTLSPEAFTFLPKALRTDVALKEHQLAGLSMLQHRFEQRELGVGGILLADDMGLGKTLQSLAFLAWYQETQRDPKPCLVVAPVSLLENWQSEIAKFLDWPGEWVLSLYGDTLQEQRLDLRSIDPELANLGLKKFLRPDFSNGFRVVLTTYETLRDYEFSLGRVDWGVLVCDEAQKIKTPSAQVTRSAKAMKADFKIACTGTPVENTLADYWCLFDFFQPGMLGSLTQFTKKFRKPIELREEGFESQVEVLRRATQPLVLRRMKCDVADLPPKIEFDHPQGGDVRAELPMSQVQLGLYRKEVNAFRALVSDENAKQKTGAILAVLHRLRLICSNPLAAQDSALAGASIAEHRRHNPKLDWMLRTLEKIREKREKAIIFTEFRDIQKLLQRAIIETFGIDVRVINGDTQATGGIDSRQGLIDLFQTAAGFGVIVLSTTAVGFGVNVQAANHVIHFTRPWNPAKEDQATDRAYRIGQTKTVFVYTPTVIGSGFESFEQRVAVRLSSKRALSREMLAPEQILTIDDFGDL